MASEEKYFAKRRVLDKIVPRIPQVGSPYFLGQVIAIAPGMHECQECTDTVRAALKTVQAVYTSLSINAWDKEAVTAAIQVLLESKAVETIYRHLFSYEDVYTVLAIGCEQYLDTMKHIWEVAS